MAGLRWFSNIALLVLLCACAARPQPVEYDRARAGVKTIALLDPGIPERPMLRYAGPATGASVVGLMFGPLGALAALPAERSAHAQIQADFGAVVAARPLTPRETLASGLDQALRDQGYRVVRVPHQRALKGDAYRMEDWLESYPEALAAGADAILDVSLVTYGYGLRSDNEQYRPMVIVAYRLVRPGSGEVLLRKSYAYANGPISDQPSDSFAVPWMNDIAKDPDKVNAGLSEGLRRAVQAIADSLK